VSDIDEAADAAPGPAAPKYYSRPPAPVMTFEPVDDDEALAELSAEDDVDPYALEAREFLRGVGSLDREAVAPEVAIIASQGDDKGLERSFLNTESLAPVAYEADHEEEDVPSESAGGNADWLSDTEKNRRWRLRRVVGGVVAAAAVAMVSFGVKASLQDQSQAAVSVPSESKAAAAAAVSPLTAETKTSKPIGASGETGVVVKVDANEEEAEVSGAAVEEEASDAATDQTVAMNDRELRAAIVARLNRGKFEEAIPLAQKLIERQPENAFGYRCLGSAYQDLGRQTEARAVYDECVKTGRTGRVVECSQLGGRNR
jgi:tetratricopeptide (TPR) repeat protein